MSLKECSTDRAKRCLREEDKGYDQCSEERDFGYDDCTQTRDDGYKDCCGWIPCKWFCDAWVWISNIVCVFWTWISNIVCVAWTWIRNMVCVAWTYATVAICMLPGVGKYITRFLDGVVDTFLDIVGGVIGGVLGVIGHPVEAVKTIISLFSGCPEVRAADPGPLEIIAHHGSALELPENTLQSCRRALALGANALEVDLCMTSDGHLILWHDWDPDSLISVTRQIELPPTDNAFKPHVPKLGDSWRRPSIELTLDEFRGHYSYQDERDAADAIRWGISHGPVDLTIPTLPEFFAAAAGWEGLRTVYLDVKMPATSAGDHAVNMVDQIHTLASHMPRDRFAVVVMVPDSVVLQAMKARSDQLGYGLVFTWDVEFPAGVILRPLKYSAVDHATSSMFHNAAASVGRPVAALFPWRVYRRTIEHDIGRRNEVNANPGTKNAGVRIGSLVAWTINERDEMECLVRMGVSGVITDKIAELAAVAGTAGR